MPLYSNEILIDNKLNKTGSMILEEERIQTRKLFGVTIHKSLHHRHTVKLDIDITSVDDEKAVGFKIK